MTTPSHDGGFTLLELLVALVVLGFILAGLSQGVRFGLQASSIQARTMEQHAELDATDRALRRLIEQMDPGTPRDGAGVQGTASRLVFVSELPDAALSRAGGQPTRRATIALGVDGARRLVLRATPRPAGRSFVPAPPPFETELLRGVDRVELAYWPRGPAPRWTAEWGGNTLPQLVRVRVVFPPGDRRHWPDIVAGPRREQAAVP